jgi:hypothetical protein
MFLLALVALFALPYLAFNVGGTVPGSGLGEVQRGTVTYGRATLTITSQRPLTVAGRGFAPLETVRVRSDAGTKRVRASRAGRFTVRFAGVDACAGGTITAVGSQGTRAGLNLSYLLCVAP